jgi:predicted enzyme related to lactoylglutathione lyase
VITNPKFVNIYVRDPQAALEFYTEKLGFELQTDQPMGPPGESTPRWIEVRPPGAQTYLVLFTPDGMETRVGGFSSVWFDCDDLDTTFKDLQAKGVEITTEPQVADWDPNQRWAQFQDPDGNVFGLSQRD